MDALAFDTESVDWLRDLQDEGGARDDAIARLHALLVKVARGEAVRRRATLPARAVEEVDDLCVQAASDALMRGSRFACAARVAGRSRKPARRCRMDVVITDFADAGIDS